MDKSQNLVKLISQYDTVVFDFDRTLANLEVNWRELKLRLADICKSKFDLEEDFTSLTKGVDRVLKERGEGAHKDLMEIIKYYESRASIKPINHYLTGFINSISRKKPRIVIYSMNTRQTIDRFIEKFLHKSPDLIIAKDNCLEPKPTKKDLVRIGLELSVGLDKIIFIGNSQNDKLSGKLAGVKTIII